MIQQYIEFLFPGVFSPGRLTRPVDHRDPPARVPEGCFGYRFFARQEVSQGGEVLSGEARDHSHYTYFGETMTADGIKNLPGDHDILLRNMEVNGWPVVVRTVRGNFRQMQDGDVCIPPESVQWEDAR